MSKKSKKNTPLPVVEEILNRPLPEYKVTKPEKQTSTDFRDYYTTDFFNESYDPRNICTHNTEKENRDMDVAKLVLTDAIITDRMCLILVEQLNGNRAFVNNFSNYAPFYYNNNHGIIYTYDKRPFLMMTGLTQLTKGHNVRTEEAIITQDNLGRYITDKLNEINESKEVG